MIFKHGMVILGDGLAGFRTKANLFIDDFSFPRFFFFHFPNRDDRKELGKESEG